MCFYGVGQAQKFQRAGGYGFLNEHQSTLGMTRHQEPPKSLLVAYAEWFL